MAISWTEVAVLSDQVLARGSTVKATLNLTAKLGAWLMLALGRGGTTALTNGVNWEIRPRNQASAVGSHPGAARTSRVSSTTACNSTTVSTTSNSGQAVLTVASGTGFAAGQIICIQDSGGGVTRLEWARISKISGGTITLDDNLQYTHTSGQADTVRNQADVFDKIWLDPGLVWDVIADYGDDTAGESITLRAIAERWDSV